jgi:hypothetical protein
MTVTDQALRLRWQIAQLADKYGIPPPTPQIEPLHAPTDQAMIFHGIAAAIMPPP